MIPTRKMTPHVPISAPEVVEDACRALELGAAVVHLHARDDAGEPTWRGEIYEAMITGIRRHFPDAVMCVSCSGRNFPEFERRSEVLELTGRAHPDMASLTMTSLDFPSGASVNAPDMVLALATLWAAAGIGLFQPPMNALGIVMGGHCSVGLEDNIFYGFDRSQLATNPALVERLVHIAGSFGRPVATHARARAMLGLAAAPTAAAGVPVGAVGVQG